MRNLVKLFNKVPTEPLREGIEWYKQANLFCHGLSIKFEIELSVVCGIMSALSPGTNYEQNKKDVFALISANKDGGRRNVRFTTYGQNVLKAQDIYSGVRNPFEAFSVKTGAKTYNFFHNLLDPSSAEFVTIDRHAFTIATEQTYKGLTMKQYEKVADWYKRAADKLGLIPCQLQAILWVDYRAKLEIDLRHRPIETPF